MSTPEDSEKTNTQFNWGKKRGRGGAKKDIQFYESFTYDGVNYSLYDCVYLFKKGEIEPYIGKLVKIWEQPDGNKKVKVLWFFRPNELLSYLGDHVPIEKEILLACGEGVGISNINPLEAIAGKCYVLCTSKDERNPQPSEEALEMADFIFYHTFDVGNLTISSQIPDKIAEVEVKYLMNKVEDLKPSSAAKLEANVIDEKGKTGEATVSPDMCKSEPLILTENNIKDDKLADKPGFTPKIDNEEKHLTEGNHLYDEKCVQKLRNEHVEQDKKSPKTKAHSRLLDENPSKKSRLSEDSVKALDGLHNRNDAGAQKQKNDYDKDTSGKDSVQLPKESSGKNKFIEKKSLPPANAVNDKKANNQIAEVTRRPDTERGDRKKWFKQVPWEGRFQTADEHGTLVLLDNLDPSYTSGEIEDIIYHSFQQSCTAKVLPQPPVQNPHYGRAYIIFKTADAADTAVRKINMGCLMLPNGRPLVASRGMLKVPLPSNTPASKLLTGHLVIDKIRRQMQHEEWKKAVSTSHCSQPNTIEYEMAMDWILIQERSTTWFNRLHKAHADDRHQIKKSLKPK